MGDRARSVRSRNRHPALRLALAAVGPTEATAVAETAVAETEHR